MLISCESTKGKNEDFIPNAPKIPNATNAIIKTLTATGYLMKYVIIFFIFYCFFWVLTTIPLNAPGTDCVKIKVSFDSPFTTTVSALK